MKITKRQLKRIIREEAKRLIEAKDFETLAGRTSPLVVNSFVKNMSRARKSPKALSDMAELWNAMVDSPGNIENARAVAESLGLASSLASWHARKIKEGEVYPTIKKTRQRTDGRSYYGRN